MSDGTAVVRGSPPTRRGAGPMIPMWRDLLRDNLAVQRRVEDHERRILALERQAGA
jgi:hypothetical protein